MPTRCRPLWPAGLVAAVLVIGLLARLPHASAPDVAGSTTPSMSLQVHLDPETGEIVPFSNTDKAQLDRAARQRLSRSSAGLREVRESDGGYRIDLEGRFQSLSLATVDSNGTLHTGCVTSERELSQFLQDHPIPDESNEE